MSTVYNSYLTGYEREIAIREAEEDLVFAKLDAMMEMVEMDLELNMKEAEAKVFKESGTYDDLEYYYEAANEEAAEKKGGILNSIANVVAGIFKAIRTAIATMFGKNAKVPDTVEVDSSDKEKVSILNKFWGKVKQLLDFLRTNNVAKVAGGVAVVATAVATGIGLFKKKSGKKEKVAGTVVKGWISDVESKAAEVADAISSSVSGDNADGKNDEDKRKVFGLLKEIGKTLRSWVEQFKAAFVQNVDKAVDQVKKTGEKAGEAVKNAANAVTSKGKDNKKSGDAAAATTESVIDGATSIFGYSLMYEAELQQTEMDEEEITELAKEFDEL